MRVRSEWFLSLMTISRTAIFAIITQFHHTPLFKKAKKTSEVTSIIQLFPKDCYSFTFNHQDCKVDSKTLNFIKIMFFIRTMNTFLISKVYPPKLIFNWKMYLVTITISPWTIMRGLISNHTLWSKSKLLYIMY